MQKTALIILDGWGYGKKDKSDAIFTAKTPFFDSLIATYPNATLRTDGENVGLPDGQMGNSEVGHLNIGAGRVVYQDLVKINLAIKNGDFFQHETLVAAFNHAKEKNVNVHFLGLISDGGVHSHLNHAAALCAMAKKQGVEKSYLHVFTDGRDTDPRSGKGYVANLLQQIEGTGAQVASVCGRYFAMDRDKRWERVAKAYHALVHGVGSAEKNPLEAIQKAYDNGATDEFIEPCIMVNEKGTPIATIEPNDVVICFNFRTDRCREITVALTQQNFPEHDMHTLPLHYVTMTRYDETFKNIAVVYEKDNLNQTLGEVVAQAGKTQLRMAETEKYPHVTFFFSGGREEPFTGERRIMANSPKVATYDLQPEMSAGELTDKAISDMHENAADFICLNYANPDMVGHTGVYEAIVTAVEFVDASLERLVSKALEKDYAILVIADHGNADFAVNEDGSPNTAHSTNPVPVVLVNAKKEVNALNHGILADVAPTILKLMDIRQPNEMSGKALF
ncbi:MAG: 2,3-bisphosphoglycerate-independent phosphoglycerate mutase [Luteibaculaceae bacterium]